MKTKVKSILKTLIKIGVSVLALWLVFQKIEFKAVFEILKQANGLLLLLAALFFIASKVISSVRLNRFFQTVSLKISEKQNLKLYWLGMYYNLFLPGGIGGDGYKVYRLNKDTKISVKDLFLAVLLDRVTGLFALACLAVLFAVFLPLPMWMRIALPFGIPVALIVFRWVLKKFFPRFLGIYIQSNLQSFLVQLAQLIATWFILLSLGVHDHILQYLFIFLISSIVAVVPFTLGGVGARELVFMYGAQFLFLQQDLSVAVSLAFYLITALVSLFGGYYSFKGLGDFKNELSLD